MSHVIDAYIATQPGPRAERLAALRAAIHAAVPDVTESIEWQMPVFRRGEAWLAMANRAAYMSVYLHSEPLIAGIVSGDRTLKSGKGCVNIPDKAELPLPALAQAFKARLA